MNCKFLPRTLDELLAVFANRSTHHDVSLPRDNAKGVEPLKVLYLRALGFSPPEKVSVNVIYKELFFCMTGVVGAMKGKIV